MKKKILRTFLKAVIFIATFFITFLIAEKLMNRGNLDMTTEMGVASLPIVYLNVNDEYINPLHGYTVDMEGSYLRGAITPLKANRELDILIDTYGATVSKVGFEVRSKDMKRLIEDTDVAGYSYEDNMITATIPVKDLIDDDTEYMLVIKITDGVGKVIKYYTRIINKSELYLSDKMQFVKDFSAKTFDKEAARDLKIYMETNAEGNNSSFGYVNIHSNFRQLTWGDLQPIVSSEKEMYLLELDTLNACIELKYRVFIKNEYYNVRECFRIKKGNDRIYLMDYERHMSQVFDEDKNVLVNGKILHGILDEKLSWTENTSGNIYCFVQENALYSFNTANNNLAKVFSFYDKNNNDIRTRYDSHGIKILSVDDSGNITFLVYGYMNRGLHEGEVGACLYYYENGVNTVDELMFIPYHKSYEMLKQDINALSYVNERNLLYIIQDGTVYRINMDTQTSEIVDYGLDENRFVSSADNSVIAWQVGKDVNDYNTIKLFSLESRAPVEIKSAEGEIIIPLGFMENDLIYGVARLGDITTDSSGSTLIPMYALRIQNVEGELLKEYGREGLYIRGIEVEDNMIVVERVAQNFDKGYFEDITPDQIMNNQSEGVTKNKYSSVVTDEMETTYQTILYKVPSSDAVKNLSPKHVIYEGSKDVVLDNEDTLERFYVYAMGEIKGVFTDEADAIKAAEQVAGVVVDKSDSYIWQTGGRYTSRLIKDIEPELADDAHSSTSVCVDSMLKYNGIYEDTRNLLYSRTVLSVLRDNLADYRVLDLTGCSLDSVLYYVSNRNPVLTMIGNESVLIVGYDSGNVTIMNPMDASITKLIKTDAKQWFNDNGNRFITYINTKQ